MSSDLNWYSANEKANIIRQANEALRIAKIQEKKKIEEKNLVWCKTAANEYRLIPKKDLKKRSFKL